MKEKYSRPTVTNADVESKSNDVLPIIGMGLGYAAGRALTRAIDARPAIKRPSLQRSKS